MKLLKQWKPLYSVYNFFNKSRLAHNLPLYKRYGLKKRYYSPISSQDFEGVPFEPNKYDRLDSREHLQEEAAFAQLKPAYQEALLPWSEKGYVVLENFFTAEQVAAVNRDVAAMIQDEAVKFRYGGKKIMFAFHQSEPIRQMGEDPQLLSILELLLSREVELFQSINFIKASEQRTHSDSIHMSTFPPGNLIAVWIALEDIRLDNGPLHYYPGSHQLPYLMNKDYGNTGSRFFLGQKTYTDYEDAVENMLTQHDFNKEVFLAKKGDLLIWHANLLHGGNPMDDPEATRKSLVFHYYAKDAICYHEVTQRPSLK